MHYRLHCEPFSDQKCTRLRDFAYTISKLFRGWYTIEHSQAPSVLGLRHQFQLGSPAFPLFLFYETTIALEVYCAAAVWRRERTYSYAHTRPAGVRVTMKLHTLHLQHDSVRPIFVKQAYCLNLSESWQGRTAPLGKYTFIKFWKDMSRFVTATCVWQSSLSNWMTAAV